MKTDQFSQSNGAFAEYVTAQAFVLSLSKPMIAALDFVYRDETLKLLDFPPSLPTIYALKRRGLVYQAESRKTPWRCTEAGKLVHGLLVLAELVQPLEPATEEVA